MNDVSMDSFVEIYEGLFGMRKALFRLNRALSDRSYQDGNRDEGSMIQMHFERIFG